MKSVNLKLFLRDEEKCSFCPDAINLAEHDAKKLSDEVEVDIELISLDETPERTKKNDISDVPTILVGENIRYVGLPVGMERQVFRDTLKMVAEGKDGTRLTEDQIKKLKNLKEKKTIKVITTSSCPYCPKVIFFSNQLAVASEGKVTSEIINSTELPHFAEKYRVTAVPTTLIDERKTFQGVPQLDEFIEELIREPPVLSYYT